MKERKFGRSIALPSTTQLKHQILKTWLLDQLRLEALERDRSLSKPSPMGKLG
jgi:hypothetical protein